MASDFTVSLVSFHFGDDAQLNLRRHRAWLERIRQSPQGTPDLVLFPEFSLTGWSYDPAAALPMGHQLVAAAVALAAEFQTLLGFGMIERDGSARYNTFVVAGPTGIAGTMRKVNLTPSESEHFYPGSDMAVIDTGRVRLGVATCADATRFEMLHLLSLRGAEIVLAPHANSLAPYGGNRDGWLRWRMERWPLYARDCAVAIAGVSCAGVADASIEPGIEPADERARRFCGGAMLMDHTGAASATLDGAVNAEGVVTGSFDLAHLRRIRQDHTLLQSFQAAIMYNREDGWQHGNPPLPTAEPS
jgi:predicted amidohydrolase